MKRIDRNTGEALVNFSGGSDDLGPLAKLQLDGAVALHNLLADQQVAYLADEVGMGKTYIALGVVAFMRRFNPDVRVLYVLPKNNVRDKWVKDYGNFVHDNYHHHDFRVKGLGGKPAAPFIICQTLDDLVHATLNNSARDFFICMSAFSFTLGDTREQLCAALTKLGRVLPQCRGDADALSEIIRQGGALQEAAPARLKQEVKQCWAKALNAVLPVFDLLVVDEAHNFRRGLQSSDRNAVLGAVLGTAEQSNRSRVRRLLLLSATPYDRQIAQLKNQLSLFGKGQVLTVSDRSTRDEIHAALATFMVRRLNEIEIENQPHTRNMYRSEYRSGDQADIVLQPEQQLFAALLQKKVSDHLQESCDGKFELGMLASFESYLPGDKSVPVQFDGQDDREGNSDDNGRHDARDRNIVEYLVEDYYQRFKTMPPHPKMDQVVRDAVRRTLSFAKKELIFVRRVRSVTELKQKLEEAYNAWLEPIVSEDPAVSYWFRYYQEKVSERGFVRSLLADDPPGGKGEASWSTFFNWFYQGQNDQLTAPGAPALGVQPGNFRAWLSGACTMFETNWTTLPGMPDPASLDIDWSKGVPKGKTPPTVQEQFQLAQYAYLHAVSTGDVDRSSRTVADRVLKVAYAHFATEGESGRPEGAGKLLTQRTLWNSFADTPELQCLYLYWGKPLFDTLAGECEQTAEGALRRLLFLQELVGAVCRIDHPFIDLYALRDRRKDDAGQTLVTAFTELLRAQQKHPDQFTSYRILRDLAENIDLLKKLNFPQAYEIASVELAKYLTGQLSPLTPVIGASGENSASRSALARRFRMPGYPRVLVSTDVFQEGEDLHTFCDRVIHYGISASPIALEQKMGRVDRVASLAHRAIRRAPREHHAHFIQVSYPHIRESMEFFQVRQAAANLNEFHRSLHQLGADWPEARRDVDINESLQDLSGIEQQITDYLRSPFVVTKEHLEGDNHSVEINEEQSRKDAWLRDVRERVQACLSAEAGRPVVLAAGEGGLTWRMADEAAIVVELRSAVGRPQLLLSVSEDDATLDDLSVLQPEARLAVLSSLQKEHLFRYQVVVSKTDRARLIRNAEIIAADPARLSDHEIRDVWRRVTRAGKWPHFGATDMTFCESLFAKLQGEERRYRIERMDNQRLRYSFADGREQTISWTVLDRHVVVTSPVLTTEQTADIAGHAGQLLGYTLQRNACFDVVDFHIDDTHALAVRAVHPVDDLDCAELAFLCHAVATEADRLQQVLLKGRDDNDGEDRQEYHGMSARGEVADTSEIEMMCLIRDLIGQGGLSKDELTRQIAYRLGYQRTSQNIAAKIGNCLLTGVRRKVIKNDGGRISLYAKSIEDYDRDVLKDQFLAALSAQSGGYVLRAVAIRAFARWMGFARTGKVIEEKARSLINGLLREQRLLARGTEEIKRC